MSVNRRSSAPADQFPFPYTTDNAEVGIDDAGDGRMIITIKVNRDALAPVLERWTWNQAKITFEAGDRNIVVAFPKIEEKVTRG